MTRTIRVTLATGEVRDLPGDTLCWWEDSGGDERSRPLRDACDHEVDVDIDGTVRTVDVESWEARADRMERERDALQRSVNPDNGRQLQCAVCGIWACNICLHLYVDAGELAEARCHLAKARAIIAELVKVARGAPHWHTCGDHDNPSEYPEECPACQIIARAEAK